MSRSGWKLPYFTKDFLKIKQLNDSKIILTMSRSSQISPKLKNNIIGIYNGRLFRFFRIRPDMFLFKFGEFVATRRCSSGLEMHINKKRKR